MKLLVAIKLSLNLEKLQSTSSLLRGVFILKSSTKHLFTHRVGHTLLWVYISLCRFEVHRYYNSFRSWILQALPFVLFRFRHSPITPFSHFWILIRHLPSRSLSPLLYRFHLFTWQPPFAFSKRRHLTMRAGKLASRASFLLLLLWDFDF